MSGYAAKNMTTFRRGLDDYSERVVKARIVSTLRRVADTMVNVIDELFEQPAGNSMFPIYTGNLRDATGVGVYVDGSVQYFAPTSIAKTPQTSAWGAAMWGEELLRKAIANGATRFARGIWIVLYSAMPYAAKINEMGSSIGRGENFFSTLEDNVWDIIKSLEPVTT